MRSTSMRKSIVLMVAGAEQDNRMITNAGATAAQNENIMHTGCYAGERENFMRENLFMTETTMAPVKIALDHGWSSIKGEHIFMETSVVQVDYTPLTNHGLLEYKGQKYIVGQGRLGKQATKTENENYFLLTLAGIAKELQYQGKTQTEHVELYAGVPLTLFGAERKEFRDYLWHKERISFTFEGVHYSIFIDKVKIYAQCYAAVANRMGDLDRLRCVDLGSWTLDVLSVRDRIPMDKDAYTYELGLITAIERIKKDALPKLKCEIPEDDIIDVIRGKQSNVNAEFVPFVEKGLQQYADEVEAKLREIKVDLLHENIVYVGGGACVMKRFGRTQGRNIQYVTDVKANAIGYRYLAENLG